MSAKIDTLNDEILKLQNENAIDHSKKEVINVATELTKILDNRKLSEVKSRSLVFNGFYDDLMNNQNDEKRLVVSLCSQELGIDGMSACDVQSVQRLGKPSEARNRPLLVTFYEHCTFYRIHILDLTYLLRKSPDPCVRHSVSVHPQLFKTELDEMKNYRQRRGEFSRRTNISHANSNNINFKNNSRATTNYQSSSGSDESASNHQSSSVDGATEFKQ